MFATSSTFTLRFLGVEILYSIVQEVDRKTLNKACMKF